MLGAHIVDDGLIIDDPDMIAKLEALASDWNCTCEEALHRALEREAVRIAERQRPE